VPSTIEPEKILKELSRIWVSLAKKPEQESSAGVLRACAMTLIVVADHDDDFQALGETLAALMPEHPSRLIVIRENTTPERSLESRVFAQCWMPFGLRQQICCEQIEITASDASLPDVPSVILSITAPDLPIVLWCRSPRVFGSRDFAPLDTVAGKVVVDSEAFPSAQAILHQLADRAGAGPALADLSWTRLTRWRGLISQVGESRSCAARLPGVTDVRITYGAEQPPIWTYYLGAWMLDALEQVGATPRLEIDRSDTNRVEFSGGGFAVSVSRLPGEAAELRVGSMTRRTMFPEPTEYLLMHEELSITGRDPIFEKTLVRAATLAKP
jgi:glucose-6-phosphate dehydrogenase assembly protein OpcA